MTLRNILVPVLPQVAATIQLDAALKLARRLEGHINAIFIRPDPASTMVVMPEMAMSAGVTLVAIEEEGRQAEAEARAAFEAWRARHGLACGIVDRALRTTFACWAERVGYLDGIITRLGRLSDLIVLNRPRPGSVGADAVFDAAVFNTSRPVLIVPDHLPHDLLGHILIAWNGSIESTRAVAGTMPLLHAAGKVSVFTAPRHSDEPEEDMDLADALIWHGIHAQTLNPRAEDASVGAALLRSATEQGATMLVMGGYTHSRVRQMLLGGVTRHVLQNATIPVVMTH